MNDSLFYFTQKLKLTVGVPSSNTESQLEFICKKVHISKMKSLQYFHTVWAILIDNTLNTGC